MLPTQTAVAIQTEKLSAQSLGIVDQYQTQIFSLLSSANSPDPMKKPRRKKLAKSDDLIPVKINPQIIRTSRGVSLSMSHQRSTSMPDFISSSAGTTVIDDPHLLPELRVDHNKYDANNNINNHQIPSSIGPSNSSILSQMPQTFMYLSKVADTDSNPSSISRSQTLGGNQLFTDNLIERNVSAPSLRENAPNYLQPPFTLTNQGSLLGLSSSIPSSLAPTFISETPLRKPTRSKKKSQHTSSLCTIIELLICLGYIKRSHLTMSDKEQQQQQPQLAQRTSPYPLDLAHSSNSNGLPTIIPASVRGTPSRSEEPGFSSNVPIPSNVMVFTPPGSIASINSPPTNMMHELPLAPVRQHLLPFTTRTVANMNLMPKQYFAAHRFPYLRRNIDDTSVSSLPFQYSTIIADGYGQYCMVPSSLIPATILPVACSSTLPETVTDQPLIPNTNAAKKEKRQSENNSQKSKVGQKAMVKMLRGQRCFNTKTRAIDFSDPQKRKHKSSNTREVRARKQLRHFTEQNRLAVLKFMMRKQKQQKQQSSLISRFPETKVEEKKPESASTPQIQQQDTESSLPDIIAPSLKISFGATQKIESIALYYHRRRQTNVDNANRSKPSIGDDNRLSLLLEAVELLETLQGNSKIIPSSNT